MLLVNPPAPDRAIWIRSQHRVGRRSRENMIWPQVSLAQLAAMLHPAYSVDIIDAIPHRMAWEEFEQLLAEKRPRYYVTQVTAPTLTNDMRGRLGELEGDTGKTIRVLADAAMGPGQRDVKFLNSAGRNVKGKRR